MDLERRQVDLTGCPTAGGVVTVPAPEPDEPTMPSTGGGLALAAAGLLAALITLRRRS